MEENASTQNLDMNENMERGRIPKNLVLVASSVLILVVILALAVFFVKRLRNTGSQPVNAEPNTELGEYQNSSGFKFSYPKNLNLIESEGGVTLSGESEIVFVVNIMEEPLSATVNSIAANFGTAQDSLDTETVDGRMGYLMSYNNSNYYYFPLVGDYYLEIVDSSPGESSKRVMSSLEFTPPQVNLN